MQVHNPANAGNDSSPSVLCPFYMSEDDGMKLTASVRRLTPDDWSQFRRVRLQALSTDPHVFSSNHSRESAWPAIVWQHRLSNSEVAVFGVFFEERMVGMTGIAVDREDATRALLWGTWLHPSVRGRQFSDAIYAVRIGWAVDRPELTHIDVSHRATNAPSRAAILKHGFHQVGTETRIWGDGTDDEAWIYELILPR